MYFGGLANANGSINKKEQDKNGNKLKIKRRSVKLQVKYKINLQL